MGEWLDDIIDNKDLYLSKHQRYRATNDVYRKQEVERNRDRTDRDPYNEQRRLDRETYPFIGWDTEGTNVNATPFLFGSSEGHRVAMPEIHSALMFETVLEAEKENPHYIHVIYGGEYDFNMMLRDLDRKNLYALKMNGKTQWYDYKIEHIPRKWLAVRRGEFYAKIFDVVSFFAAPYVQALEENGIGSDDDIERIKEGKAGRSSFTYQDLDFIEPYWRTELRLLPELMDRLRESFYRAGCYIHSWHGPGSLARYALRHNKIKERMAISLPDVHSASRYAFCGGRFESFQAGLTEGTVYNADINSAYPYAATFLPDLSNGTWEHVTNVDRSIIRRDQFALYHISYYKGNEFRTELCVEPQPLFRRLHDDRVQWPNVTEGWYWSPEAFTVRENPYANFIEAWIFHDSGYRPFKFIADEYRQRQVLKRLNDPMQLTLKLKINSIYGQLAMRAGWQRYKGPPPYHQLEWAGFITSMCRSMVYETAMYCWQHNGLISIDTDGIFSTVPLPSEVLHNGAGSNLGEWDTADVPGMLNWQSGVYWLPKTDDLPIGTAFDHWYLKKARGAPRGQVPFRKAATALGTLGDIIYKRNEFIGYRWALRNGFDTWRYFVEKDRVLQFGGSEFSKRFHQPRACRLCRGRISGSMHDLHPVGNGFSPDPKSKMHVLPWEKINDHERIRDTLDLKAETVIDVIWTEEG